MARSRGHGSCPYGQQDGRAFNVLEPSLRSGTCFISDLYYSSSHLVFGILFSQDVLEFVTLILVFPIINLHTLIASTLITMFVYIN